MPPNHAKSFRSSSGDKWHSVTLSPSDFATRYTPTNEEDLLKTDFARTWLLRVSRRTHLFFAGVDDYNLSTDSPDIELTSPVSGIPGGVYFDAGNSTGFYVHRFN